MKRENAFSSSPSIVIREKEWKAIYVNTWLNLKVSQVNLSHGKSSERPSFLQREIHVSNTFAAHASVSLNFLSLARVLSFEELSSIIYMLYTKSKLLMLQTETTHIHMHTLHHHKRVPIRPK